MAQTAEHLERGRLSFDRRGLLAFGALGVAAYALTLAATVPAGVALSGAGLAPSGTIWNGEANLNGSTAAWKVRPLRSLLRLSVSADVTVRGSRTELAGQADWRPGRLVMQDVAGRADGSLIAALAPRLPFTCDLMMQVDLKRIVVSGRNSGAVGEVRSEPGACSANVGEVRSAAPAMTVVSTMDHAGWKAVATPRLDPATRLGEASLAPDGLLTLSVRPAGAAVFPGASAVGASWEFRL